MEKQYFKALNSELKTAGTGVHIKYVMLQCDHCGRTWGVVMDKDQDTISKKNSTCFSCFTERALSE